jgi:hypothetical protein
LNYPFIFYLKQPTTVSAGKPATLMAGKLTTMMASKPWAEMGKKLNGGGMIYFFGEVMRCNKVW